MTVLHSYESRMHQNWDIMTIMKHWDDNKQVITQESTNNEPGVGRNK